MNERLATATIGEIVATDFRTAGVFEHFGIDFCCGGRRSFTEACRTAAADPLIALLTKGYVAPSNGCVTYAVSMAEMARFELDLHQHVHLENNVLFPRALELEHEACGVE